MNAVEKLLLSVATIGYYISHGNLIKNWQGTIEIFTFIICVLSFIYKSYKQFGMYIKYIVQSWTEYKFTPTQDKMNSLFSIVEYKID